MYNNVGWILPKIKERLQKKDYERYQDLPEDGKQRLFEYRKTYSKMSKIKTDFILLAIQDLFLK